MFVVNTGGVADRACCRADIGEGSYIAVVESAEVGGMELTADEGDLRLEDDFLENKSRSDGRELRRAHWEFGDEGEAEPELDSDLNGGNERRL